MINKTYFYYELSREVLRLFSLNFNIKEGLILNINPPQPSTHPSSSVIINESPGSVGGCQDNKTNVHD